MALYRSQHRYEVLEAGDFKCVALVKEVPEVAEEAEEGEASAASTGPDVDTSRAAASANMESLRKQQQRGDTRGGSAAAVDGEQLRAAVEAGSLNRLLALGVPRLEAGEVERVGRHVWQQVGGCGKLGKLSCAQASTCELQVSGAVCLPACLLPKHRSLCMATEQEATALP